MKAAGDLVAFATKLATSVQNGENYFECRLLELWVPVDRDPSAIVRDRDRVIRVDRDVDSRAVACECFIYRVIHDFVDKVVEAFGAGGSDIHPRSLANRF